MIKFLFVIIILLKTAFVGFTQNDTIHVDFKGAILKAAQADSLKVMKGELATTRQLVSSQLNKIHSLEKTNALQQGQLMQFKNIVRSDSTTIGILKTDRDLLKKENVQLNRKINQKNNFNKILTAGLLFVTGLLLMKS